MHGVISRPAASQSPQVLIPFDAREAICLKEAAARAGKGETTIRNWCRDHHIGRRVGGGVWMVSCVALAMFLDGDEKALRAYLAGDRASEQVRRYFERFAL
jgi:hypothetical protein